MVDFHLAASQYKDIHVEIAKVEIFHGKRKFNLL